MKHEIILDFDYESEEEFEEDGDNILDIMVFNKDNEEITKNCKVQLNLSKNALIGLGTEMIRMAYNFREGKHQHIPPIRDKDSVYQAMGVLLTPESCELTICCTENGTIEDHKRKFR